jgi:hypothetical protein
MSNIIQEAKPVTQAELIKQDGQTQLAFINAEAKVSMLTRKTADGTIVETGVKQTEFLFRKTKSQLESGEGIIVVNEDGTTSVYSEIKFVGKEMNADAIAQASAAKRFENLIKDVRRFVGLGSSKKVVSASDKLTSKDLENWMNGFRKVKGYHFEELPADVQEKASKVYADSIKKVASKPATLLQLAEMAALAAENGTPLGDDWHKEFEAAKVRASRLGKGKAKPVEVGEELTEQSDI